MDQPSLHGEFVCRLDAKGRIKVPAQLLRQFPGTGPYKFFMNRGFEKCVMIYPEKVWEKNLDKISTLNTFRIEDRSFIRNFFRGVSEVTTDAADRILIAKHLLGHIEANRDLILFAYLDRMELWDKAAYEDVLDQDPKEFAELAERVLGSASGAKDG